MADQYALAREHSFSWGCLYITDRYIAVGIGGSDARRLISTRVEFDVERDVSRVYIPWPSREALEKAYEEAFRVLLTMRKAFDAIVIGSCVPLKSNLSDDRFFEKNEYGVVAKNDTMPEWRGFNFYETACSYLEGMVSRTNIFVRNDASLSGLGEYHWRLQNGSLASPSDMAKIEHGFREASERRYFANRQATLVYLKLSSDINGAAVYQGDLLGGRNHAFLSLIRPRRMEADGMIDPFLGICNIHQNCYYGMISSKAMQARLDAFYDSQKAKKRPSFNQLEEDHPLAEILVYYVAQLCITMLATHVPSVIVLGGRLLNDRLDDKQVNKNIAVRVDAEVKRHLSLLEGRTETPHYPDLFRSDGFIQEARCPHSGVYGGLVFGSRNYDMTARSESAEVVSFFRGSSG